MLENARGVGQKTSPLWLAKKIPKPPRPQDIRRKQTTSRGPASLPDARKKVVEDGASNISTFGRKKKETVALCMDAFIRLSLKKIMRIPERFRTKGRHHFERSKEEGLAVLSNNSRKKKKKIISNASRIVQKPKRVGDAGRR